MTSSYTPLKKASVLAQRYRRPINWALYFSLLGVMIWMLWDPSIVEVIVPFIKFDQGYDSVEGDAGVLRSNMAATSPAPVTRSVVTLMGFSFLPRDFACEDMFLDAGHNFTYPETYWDHADAYKGALQMNDLIQEGVANEHSWVITELGALKFVKTVCETGFNAGHNTFHWLTAQEDSIVHSFDRAQNNYSIDMADFMSIEFPDRFYGYPGDTKETVAKFVKENLNKTFCDIVFIDSTQDTDTIRSNMEEFRKLANPLENIVVMDAHPRNRAGSDLIWQDMRRRKVIREHFRCFFKEFNDSGTTSNQRGLLVGSYYV